MEITSLLYAKNVTIQIWQREKTSTLEEKGAKVLIKESEKKERFCLKVKILFRFLSRSFWHFRKRLQPFQNCRGLQSKKEISKIKLCFDITEISSFKFHHTESVQSFSFIQSYKLSSQNPWTFSIIGCKSRIKSLSLIK